MHPWWGPQPNLGCPCFADVVRTEVEDHRLDLCHRPPAPGVALHTLRFRVQRLCAAPAHERRLSATTMCPKRPPSDETSASLAGTGLSWHKTLHDTGRRAVSKRRQLSTAQLRVAIHLAILREWERLLYQRRLTSSTRLIIQRLKLHGTGLPCRQTFWRTSQNSMHY